MISQNPVIPIVVFKTCLEQLRFNFNVMQPICHIIFTQIHTYSHIYAENVDQTCGHTENGGQDFC